MKEIEIGRQDCEDLEELAQVEPVAQAERPHEPGDKGAGRGRQLILIEGRARTWQTDAEQIGLANNHCFRVGTS